MLVQSTRSYHVYTAKRSSSAKTLSHYPWSPNLLLNDTSWIISEVTRHKSILSASFGDLNPLTDTANATDQVDGDGPGEQFGTISSDIGARRSFQKSSPEIQNQCFQEEDGEDEVKRRKPFMAKGRNTTYWYFLQCKNLLKENKVSLSSFYPHTINRNRATYFLSNDQRVCWPHCTHFNYVLLLFSFLSQLQQALDLFSGDMLKRERLQPEEYNYTILIGGCGRAGQLKKAFKLYNDVWMLYTPLYILFHVYSL